MSNFTRRALLAGAGATASSAALGAAMIPAAHSAAAGTLTDRGRESLICSLAAELASLVQQRPEGWFDQIIICNGVVSQSFSDDWQRAMEPWTRANRLATNLAETLDQLDDGQWRVSVVPASRDVNPVAFEEIDASASPPTPLDMVDEAFALLAKAMDRLPSTADGWRISGGRDRGSEAWLLRHEAHNVPLGHDHDAL